VLHLPPANHKTRKHDSPNETKVKEKQNKTIPDLNSNLAKSMTHHNQTKELTTWFLRPPMYPLLAALANNLVKIATTMLNNKGDRGSPYLCPFPG
jgi:hypothetical protein